MNNQFLSINSFVLKQLDLSLSSDTKFARVLKPEYPGTFTWLSLMRILLVLYQVVLEEGSAGGCSLTVLECSADCLAVRDVALVAGDMLD